MCLQYHSYAREPDPQTRHTIPGMDLNDIKSWIEGSMIQIKLTKFSKFLFLSLTLTIRFDDNLISCLLFTFAGVVKACCETMTPLCSLESILISFEMSSVVISLFLCLGTGDFWEAASTFGICFSAAACD